MSGDDVRAAQGNLQALLKAFVVTARASDAASVPGGEGVGAWFQGSGALEPPYDPETLCLLAEHSNALRQNVDAYCTNIDGFGFRLEPTLDLDAPDADERVRDVMVLERAAALDGQEAGGPPRPSDEEVAARTAELRHEQMVERARIEAFFESCSLDGSFVALRRRTRQDLETTGNAYWEILRDGRGAIARLVYVPSYTMRLMPLDLVPVDVTERVRVSPVTFEEIQTRQRLRRYVQVQYGQRTYFRSFGDPRTISRTTGDVFTSVDELRRLRPDDAPATEILHFAIPSPRSPYGIPRWIGSLLSVLGSRQMEEVNYLYFENKSVPPLALLVSGGRLSEASVPRIERFIEENLRGKANFHKILVLEAEGGTSASDAGRAKIELHPLTDAQQHDALFQTYDERNIDKIGSAFRLPRLLRGDSRDFNRSVADAQLRFAEDQVFQPERDDFDFLVNRKLLADMGIRFWRFRSQTTSTRDPERLAGMIERLVRVGVLTPEEGRMLAGDVFNRELRRLDADWTKRPLTLTLAGIQTGAEDLQSGARPGGVAAQAKEILALREELAAQEEGLSARRMALARESLRAANDVERFRVPATEWSRWFDEDDDE